ncbi:hypothetical protein [Nannocystis pusilla]|uniref:hypothetical protein n=1 Tax=Nannocystis pusilla TaxID=889268 RepID=UPI003DA6C631
MPYLSRRVAHLLSHLKSGKLVLSSEQRQELDAELTAVKFDEEGAPILETVSSRLRSWARAYFIASQGLDRIEQGQPEGDVEQTITAPTSNDRTTRTMRELFQHYDNVFCAYTNSKPHLFTKGQSFAAAIRAAARSWESDRGLAERTLRAGSDAMRRLVTFYEESGSYLFRAARELPGLKLVLGGTQSFTDKSASAVRSMALYGDTVAIPDPVYRWVEVEPESEAFPLPRMLQDIHEILALKPLVDADLPFPALIVFPSWEGRLDRYDTQTQDSQELMLMRFFGHHLDAHFEDVSEIFDYAQKHSDDVLAKLAASRLLVAYGANGNEDVATQIEMIRSFIKENRTPEFQAFASRVPPAVLAVNMAMERLGPLYHLNENADEMGAAPLMSLPVHWHFYEHLAKVNEGLLIKDQALPPDIVEITKGLSSSDKHWLGNVPVDILVDLRKRGENQDFRRKLKTQLDELRSVTSSTIAQTVPLVERALQQLATEHERDLTNLRDKYGAIYTPLAVTSWFTLAASFIPFFPALTPLAAVGAISGYVGAKANERRERVRLGRTLTGVLAASAKK